MTGRTQPYFFSFDTKSKPGKLIAHFITFDTLEIDARPGSAGMDANMKLLGADVEKDKRIRHMIQSAHSFRENNPSFFEKEKGKDEDE